MVHFSLKRVVPTGSKPREKDCELPYWLARINHAIPNTYETVERTHRGRMKHPGTSQANISRHLAIRPSRITGELACNTGQRGYRPRKAWQRGLVAIAGSCTSYSKRFGLTESRLFCSNLDDDSRVLCHIHIEYREVSKILVIANAEIGNTAIFA